MELALCAKLSHQLRTTGGIVISPDALKLALERAGLTLMPMPASASQAHLAAHQALGRESFAQALKAR